MSPPTDPESPASNGEPVRMEKPVYGGDGLAHTASGAPVLIPFVLPGESVVVPVSPGSASATLQPAVPTILEASPARAEPRCVHFGVCGGCQYQMADYPLQLAMKEAILRDTLAGAGITTTPPLRIWGSPEAYGYRNRIRLRVRRVHGTLRLGYNARGTKDFLPVSMCPIAAPLLWEAAEAFLTAAAGNREAAKAFDTAAELELFCDAEELGLQATLLYAGDWRGPGRLDALAFAKAMDAVRALLPALRGAGAIRVDAQSGRPLAVLASWGAPGLAYPVRDETYWITRGGFFQVNRFLLPTLVEGVCAERSGALAWDLFAGVGLFSRVLARRFGAVTAVESNPTAHADLARALAKLGPEHRAVQSATLDFLRRAVLERERPELIVLDPPRAGAGEEACRLLARLAPAEIVYLSCDPTTLARDLAVLLGRGYTLTELHLIDLFPQTYHLETLVVLRRHVAD